VIFFLYNFSNKIGDVGAWQQLRASIRTSSGEWIEPAWRIGMRKLDKATRLPMAPWPAMAM